MAKNANQGEGKSVEKDMGKEWTVKEAGRKGGEKTASTHGSEFYKKIGRDGGEARKKKEGKNEKEESGIPEEGENASEPDLDELDDDEDLL